MKKSNNQVTYNLDKLVLDGQNVMHMDTAEGYTWVHHPSDLQKLQTELFVRSWLIRAMIVLFGGFVTYSAILTPPAGSIEWWWVIAGVLCIAAGSLTKNFGEILQIHVQDGEVSRTYRLSVTVQEGVDWMVRLGALQPLVGVRELPEQVQTPSLEKAAEPTQSTQAIDLYESLPDTGPYWMWWTPVWFPGGNAVTYLTSVAGEVIAGVQWHTACGKRVWRVGCMSGMFVDPRASDKVGQYTIWDHQRHTAVFTVEQKLDLANYLNQWALVVASKHTHNRDDANLSVTSVFWDDEECPPRFPKPFPPSEDDEDKTASDPLNDWSQEG